MYLGVSSTAQPYAASTMTTHVWSYLAFSASLVVPPHGVNTLEFRSRIPAARGRLYGGLGSRTREVAFLRLAAKQRELCSSSMSKKQRGSDSLYRTCSQNLASFPALVKFPLTKIKIRGS